MATFSERLKQLRTEKKLTQEDIAKRVNVNRVTYTNWENGKRAPELSKLVELATELNSTVDYLLGNSDINLLEVPVDVLSKELNTEEIAEMFKANLEYIVSGAQEKFGVTQDEAWAMMQYLLKAEVKKDD